MNEPAARHRVATYWCIAAEVIRRNPQLKLRETNPRDGFYDRLTAHGATGGSAPRPGRRGLLLWARAR